MCVPLDKFKFLVASACVLCSLAACSRALKGAIHPKHQEKIQNEAQLFGGFSATVSLIISHNQNGLFSVFLVAHQTHQTTVEPQRHLHRPSRSPLHEGTTGVWSHIRTSRALSWSLPAVFLSFTGIQQLNQPSQRWKHTLLGGITSVCS